MNSTASVAPAAPVNSATSADHSSVGIKVRSIFAVSVACAAATDLSCVGIKEPQLASTLSRNFPGNTGVTSAAGGRVRVFSSSRKMAKCLPMAMSPINGAAKVLDVFPKFQSDVYIMTHDS